MRLRDPLTDAGGRDELYEQLVELAPDGIIIHDGELIVDANAAALRLVGASTRDELVGQPISRLLDPPHLKGVERQLMGTSSESVMAPAVRETLRRLDGETLDVEVRAVVFLDQGQPAAHLVIRDISERLAVEEALRRGEERVQRAQRMESVGALAGGVAHEVNNMMSVILGCGAFLLEDQAAPADALADVREMMKAAERAASVTRQLLAFSRHAASRPEPVDIAGAVRSAEPMLRRLIGAGRRLVFVADAAPTAAVDAGQLDQVIVNLVLNARDATVDGGRIVIMASEQNLSEPQLSTDGSEIPPGRYAAVSVRDDGSGIDTAVQARIFEPFFTTKPLGEGTGLGLAAVHGIVKQNLGFITLVSAPGAGTTFTVLLPAVVDSSVGASLAATSPTVPSSRVPADSPAAREAGSDSVLVVDDEPSIRAIVAKTLERVGLRVMQATDGVDALELVERLGPPSLVLTDLRMPRLGGLELADRLKTRWPELPVLLMSGYSVGFLRLEGTTATVEDLIQKPFTAESLTARVLAALSSARAGA